MLKELKEFFTGGEEVKQARLTIQRYGSRRRLSPGNQQLLEEATKMSRRHFLKLTALGTAGLIGSGTGLWKFGEWLSKPTYRLPDQPTGPLDTETSPDYIKASALRQQIRDFERENYNHISTENLTTLTNLIAELYGETFGRKTLSRRLVLVSNDFYKEQELPDSEISEPTGHTGIIYFLADQNNRIVGVQDIPLIINLGDPNTNDPEINKLSVFRALIMHEFIHTQTKPTFISGEVSIGKERFQAAYTRGLKWILSLVTTSQDLTRENEKAGYFDEVNTQLLTESLNDPTGGDDLFVRMTQSLVYKHSLAPNFIWGASLLRGIYEKLGISTSEVAHFQFNAQPKELLEKIDDLIYQRGIILPQPASSILIKMNLPNPQTEEGLEPLKELASMVK